MPENTKLRQAAAIPLKRKKTPQPFLLNDTIITRPRLLQQSPLQTGKRLTALVAPAGFGKTVLMAQWAQQAESEEVSTSWYRISDSDNRPDALFANLVALLKSSSFSWVETVAEVTNIEQLVELR